MKSKAIKFVVLIVFLIGCISSTLFSQVRLNQVGYFPNAQKKATAVNGSNSPVNWYLKNSGGATVLSGTTSVFGHDGTSNDHVHIVDFSAYTIEGTGYVLSVDGSNSSHPFDINSNIYSQMKFDALAYFYHNRSGIAIEMPYAGRDNLTRPAGHTYDSMATWPDSGQPNYSLNVSKGWYDAGDHGKYVVNGGISVWTMMNQYERALVLENADKSILNDGSLNIPERNNGYPDILDEARWQMEMLLGFQVPDNQSYAGMAHHKGHDEKWTGIPLLPSDDPQPRYLAPPTTAATLNLAATAAQSSRLWASLDPSFSSKCLIAAEKAWNAAINNPNKNNKSFDDAKGNVGGGKYGDTDYSDEFYWAACELYVTTGKDVYRNYIQSSHHYLAMPSVFASGEDVGLTGAFTWASTQGLGTVTLALVPNGLSSWDIQTARDNMANAADHWIGIMEGQGYIQPNADFLWGSNSFMVNQMVVMALAYDFTGDAKYLDAVTTSMDYILGRNAMDKSYVTGYGENPLQNPHHRFWAYQKDNGWPTPPAGAISGGPNQKLEDPYAQEIGLPGSPVQKCFVDNIESWSTNEITINWNAPFAWVTGWLDEHGNGDVLSVTLDSPYEGQLYRQVDPVVMSASTTGDVAYVDFLLNGTLVNRDNEEPYEYNAGILAGGSYSVSAEATSTGGQTVSSESVNILVDDGSGFPPSVSLSAPKGGSVHIEGQPITVSANASDIDGSVILVEFFADAEKIGESTGPSFEISWTNAALGLHTITARATDNDGLQTESSAVSIEVIEQGEGILLPGVIQVEDYIGFSDSTPGNEGGAYRNDDVDIEVCNEGGHNVGWIEAGEYLEFDVTVTETAAYSISIRTAREEAGDGFLHIELDGQDVSGSITAPGTGNWQSFTTTTKSGLALTAGFYKLKVVMDSGPFNLNWIEFKSLGDEIMVEAESYTTMNGVQTEPCDEGGLNVGYIDENDWMEYSVTAPKAGNYTVEYRVAGWNNAAALQAIVNGQAGDIVAVPNSGAYQAWTSTEGQMTLSAGVNTVRILSKGPGWNINWFKLTNPEDPKFTLTLTPSGMTTGAGSYDADSQVSISYTGADPFIRWTGDTATVADVNRADTTVTMTGNITLRAEYDGGIEVIHVEAEDFDDMSGIIVADDGQSIGWVDVGDWLDYTIVVDTAFEWYAVDYRIASAMEGGKIDFIIDGHTENSTVVPNTGNWAGWQTEESRSFKLSQGTHTIRLYASGAPWNLDWFEIKEGEGGHDFDNPVDYYGEMVVNGNRIYGSRTGEPMQVKGMSFFWSNWGGDHWNDAMVDRMVDEFKCEVIRLPYGIKHDGTPYDYGNESMVRSMINKAQQRGVYVIIDWHTHGAENNVGAAKDFFRTMAQDFGHLDNVIFEVYNEPDNKDAWGNENGHMTTWSEVKTYAEQVIPEIRNYSNNLIVVGTPVWSQLVDDASKNKITSADNIAYGLHFYAGGGESHNGTLQQRALTALGNDAALFVTEWGTTHNDGGQWITGNRGIYYDETNAWIKFMDDHQISWCNWAVMNKEEDSGIFNPWTTDLSESGRFLKDILNSAANYAPWR